MNLHNGSIRAHSEGEGKGSSFTVSINMQRRCNPRSAPGDSHDLQDSLDHPPIFKNEFVDTVLTLSCESKDVCQDIMSSDTGYSNTGYVGSRGTTQFPRQSIEVSHLSLSEKVSNRSIETRWFNTRSPVESTRRCSRKGSKSAETRSDSSAGDSKSDCGSSIPVYGSTPDEKYDVLIVDDSSLNRKMLCRIFKSAGHTCDEADDGLAAVEKVKAKMSGAEGERRVYDAVLMDFVMPNMDGPTATKIIRELGYLGPVFGVTGNALDSDVTHFLCHGAEYLLTKPFDFSKFKQLIKDIESGRGMQSDELVRPYT